MAGETAEGDDEGDVDGDTRAEQEMGEGEQGEEGEEGMMPVRPNRPWTDITEGFDYKAYTNRFDEVVNAQDLCDLEELDRLRAYRDSQLKGLQGVVTRLAKRIQRRPMEQKHRARDLEQEEGGDR